MTYRIKDKKIREAVKGLFLFRRELDACIEKAFEESGDGPSITIAVPKTVSVTGQECHITVDKDCIEAQGYNPRAWNPYPAILPTCRAQFCVTFAGGMVGNLFWLGEPNEYWEKVIAFRAPFEPYKVTESQDGTLVL